MVVGGGDVRSIRRDTVNERAVRILLECILVMFPFTKNYFPSCLLDCNPFTSATHTAGMNGFAPACSYFYSNIVDVQFIVAQSG